ncbi:MAG: trypsin-like peptidase domain-containing protein [Parcubacteria group bacterium]|nr:trypsin-like peptidase domain-containing protein [Parcubacteria group bacterium]
MKHFRLVVASFAVFILLAGPTLAKEPPLSFSSVVKRVSSAVISIETTRTVTEENPEPQNQQDMLPPGSPLRKLFPKPKKQEVQKRKVVSVGAGSVISPDGYIVTNNHVVRGADSIEIIFSDDTHTPAKIIGQDAKTDIAVLKIDSPKPLAHLVFGNSESVEVGDWVIAVGNPFNLRNTVSVGIISAKHRKIPDMLAHYLQTDTSINQGNSGGPLFNLTGEVIGINTAIFSLTGGSIGIGFALPSNETRHVVDELRTHGKLRQVWFGVRPADITEEHSPSIRTYKDNGVLITEVTIGSPAHGGGLKNSDIVVSFNEKRIKTVDDLKSALLFARIGSNAKVRVVRNGRNVELSILIKEKPETSN